MRSKPRLFTNYDLYTDLFPLSKAPNKEHPFKDENFEVKTFKRIGDWLAYWRRERGKTVSIDGEIKDEASDNSGKSWAIEPENPYNEFFPTDWQLIANILMESQV